MMKHTVAIMLTLSIAYPLSAAETITAEAFATKAAQTDMFEMQAAKIALEKGVSDEVKAFADNMIKDHYRTTSDLKDAAGKDGVQLPAEMGSELQTKLKNLEALSGPALDAAYVSTQVSVHTDAVELFDKYSKDGEAGALKSFAMSYYPTIRMHLIRARSFNVEQ